MTTTKEKTLKWTCNCRKIAPQTRPTSDKISDRCQKFILSDDTLKHITSLFLEEVKKGLARKTHDTAAVKCYVTYVQDLPRGSEHGRFLGMDLSSQILRLLLCEITERGLNLKTRSCRIPEYTLFSTGEQLFDNVMDHLAKFIKDEHLLKEKVYLAVTFGFPLMQRGLQKGFLLSWTKGFKCSNVVGKDVIQLMKDAIERRGDIAIEICAILNDTTGTLISCAYDHSHCKIGVVICEGTNACYMEKQKNAELFDEESESSDFVLINTEWGAFGDDGILNFLRTDLDYEVDENSINRGKALFEKMISGFYLGELVRLILVQFTRDGYLFNGEGSAQLYTSETFSPSYIYNVENDPPGTYTNCKKVLRALGLEHASNDDCTNLRYICECISRRSGQLVGAALAALINKINEPEITIGIDGSVYTNHPHYHNIIVTTLEKLVKRNIKYKVVNAEDGSGRGAALLAAAISKRKSSSYTG